jgi:hypothetical protein
MSRIVNLPSGATATFRDARELKQKDRQALLAATTDDTNASAAVSFVNSLIAIMVTEWSFDLVPPSVKIESLGELSIADYDVLAEEADGAMTVLFPNLRKTEATDADPKATTAASNG